MEVNKYNCEFMLHEYVEMETTDNTDMAENHFKHASTPAR